MQLSTLSFGEADSSPASIVSAVCAARRIDPCAIERGHLHCASLFDMGVLLSRLARIARCLRVRRVPQRCRRFWTPDAGRWGGPHPNFCKTIMLRTGEGGTPPPVFLQTNASRQAGGRKAPSPISRRPNGNLWSGKPEHHAAVRWGYTPPAILENNLRLFFKENQGLGYRMCNCPSPMALPMAGPLSLTPLNCQGPLPTSNDVRVAANGIRAKKVRPRATGTGPQHTSLQGGCDHAIRFFPAFPFDRRL